MTTALTIYHNPKCSKSLQALQIIEAQGIKPKIIHYLDTPPSAETLAQILKKLKLKAYDILRAHEPLSKQLGLNRFDTNNFNANNSSEANSRSDLDHEALIQILVANPSLLQRPIITTTVHAVIGRPPENVLELLT